MQFYVIRVLAASKIEEDKGIIRGKERREDHRGEEVYAICHQINGQFRPYVTIGGTIDIRLVS